MAPPRSYRAGESVEDVCRACKTDRLHTVIVVDAGGRPIRVMCGFCRSEHNYRGGPRMDSSGAAAEPRSAVAARTAPAVRAPMPIVTQPERTVSPMAASETPGGDFERLLRRIIR